MKAAGKMVLAAVAAALVVPALAAEVQSYGRAAGAVGTDRVEQIASYVNPQDLREFDSGYGRAGGPVAKAPVRTRTPDRKADTAVAWFGRAGGALPFSG
jgi:hypothetical protein